MSAALSQHPFSNSQACDVSHWLRRVDCLQVVNSWTDFETFCYASASLVGEAAVWLDTISVATWFELKHLMFDRFGESLETLYAHLESFNQGHSSVGLYTDKFRSLLQKLDACGTHIPAATILMFYLDGLRPDLQSLVLFARPSTLDGAVESALYYEEESFSHSLPLGKADEQSCLWFHSELARIRHQTSWELDEESADEFDHQGFVDDFEFFEVEIAGGLVDDATSADQVRELELKAHNLQLNHCSNWTADQQQLLRQRKSSLCTFEDHSVQSDIFPDDKLPTDRYVDSDPDQNCDASEDGRNVQLPYSDFDCSSNETGFDEQQVCCPSHTSDVDDDSVRHVACSVQVMEELASEIGDADSMQVKNCEATTMAFSMEQQENTMEQSHQPFHVPATAEPMEVNLVALICDIGQHVVCTQPKPVSMQSFPNDAAVFLASCLVRNPCLPCWRQSSGLPVSSTLMQPQGYMDCFLTADDKSAERILFCWTSFCVDPGGLPTGKMCFGVHSAGKAEHFTSLSFADVLVNCLKSHASMHWVHFAMTLLTGQLNTKAMAKDYKHRPRIKLLVISGVPTLSVPQNI